MCCEGRQEDLVAHLYGELEGEEATRFQEHLESCDQCRRELARLSRVRERLVEWRELEEPWRTPAPIAAGGRGGLGERLRRWWGAPVGLPRWALGGALAAVLLLALAGARVSITRDESGIRLGWGAPPQVAGTTVSVPATGRLEQWSAPERAVWDEALLGEVHNMLARSEERQLVTVSQLLEYYTRQIESAREQDMQAMTYGLGNLSGETRLELARTNQRLRQVAELLMGRGSAGEPGTAEAVLPGEARLEGMTEPRGVDETPYRR